MALLLYLSDSNLSS